MRSDDSLFRSSSLRRGSLLGILSCFAAAALPATPGSAELLLDSETAARILADSPGEQRGSLQSQRKRPMALPEIGGAGAADAGQRAQARTEAVVVLQAGRGASSPLQRAAGLRAFVETEPQHPHAPAVALEWGEGAYRDGLFSEALHAYGQARHLAAERGSDPAARALVDQARANEAGMLARLGRKAELESLLTAIDNESGQPEATGRAGQLLLGAREGLHFMRHRPDIAYLCGPTALQTLHRQQFGRPSLPLYEERSTEQGVSLARLVTLAGESGLGLQAAFREFGAPIIAPAVVHWELDHYAALVETRDGRHHIVDPTFADDFWLRPEALDAESSGYFLVREGDLPEGWRAVGAEEAAEVWGRGFVQARNTASTRRSDRRSPQNRSCSLGMAAYSAHLHMVSLNLTDIPLAYSPAYGPELAFELNYVERDLSQPAVPTHGHLGPQWLHRFHGYLDFEIDAGLDKHEVEVALPGGGSEQHVFPYALPVTTPPAGPGSYLISLYSPAHPETGSRLQAIFRSDDGEPWEIFKYRLNYPDGTHYSFNSHATIDTTDGTRFYLRFIRDTVGPAAQLKLNYEAISPGPAAPAGARRLLSITDAAGGVSQVLYADRLGDFPELSLTATTTDPLRIIGFLDPAGRLAELRYDTEGRLETIVDAAGIASSFAYEGSSDRVASLTTPYGTSQFRRGGLQPGDPNVLGWLELEDALGRIERLEYTQNATGVSSADPEAPSSEDILIRPRNSRQFRNTFYWDHQAMAKHRGEYAMAHTYHWLHIDGVSKSTGILESYQPPLESRVYYNYPGMTEPEDATLADQATLLFPSRIGRLGDDGETWLESTEYNAAANITRFTDAAGRENVVDYYSDGMRPESVKLAGQALVHYTYGSVSLPLLPTIIHRAGEAPLTLTYNSVGQVLTATQESDTTTYVYDQPDSSSGYTKGNLLTITGPGSSGILATFTHDAANRIQTVTDSLGHTLTFAYDGLDRLTTTTYPDGSTEVTDYGDRLLPESFTDRLGHLTVWEYDDSARLQSEIAYGLPTEAALQGVGAQVTHYQWCDCGSLSAITDPAGNTTRWEHDVLGRVTHKTTPDGRATQFDYTPRLGRLHRTTDPNGIETSRSYSPVGELVALDFSDGQTPGLRYNYDPDFGWLETVDSVAPGTETVVETVAYSYHPYAATVASAVNGAGSLATETGTAAGSTVEYLYDSRGRLDTQTLLDAAQNPVHQTTWQWDALDRLEAHTDGLGSYGYDYDAASDRLDFRTLPGGLIEDYGYQTAAQGGRLNALSRRIGSAAPFTSYGYSYFENDQLENIIEDRSGAPQRVTDYLYDSQQRLQSATSTPSGADVERFDYIVDPAGNRITALSPGRVAHWRSDAGNQLHSQMALGLRRVVGTVDQPAHVTINGQPIPVDDELRFEGFVNTLDTREVLIEATDGADNTTTTGYWFAEPDNTQGSVIKHDRNGNLTEVESHTETRTYEWDALNRLIQAEVMAKDGSSGLRKTYHYDPVSRLTRTETESWDGSAWLPDDSFHYVYAGLDRIEKRAADGITVLLEYFADGFIEGSNAYLYGRDHLGSIVELIEASTGAVVSTRAFSPYGRILEETGTVQADFAFTGHFYDTDFDLHHAPARVYDANLGRWLSEDPLTDAEMLPEGTNLYAYVGNDPVNFTDPFGFCRQSANTAQGSKASPPRQSGGSGTGNGGPPKRTASSASPQDPGGGNLGRGGARTPGQMHKHHTVPREILKQLPPDIARNPLVRGRAGAPNRWKVPADIHRKIHRGPGGGAYNQFFKDRLNPQALGGRQPTVNDVLRIREEAVRHFNLGRFRPGG